jgi:hypothetical protein
MKHLLHLNKLWTIYHFMFIETIDVACIWQCLMCFLTPLCYFYGYHYGLFFLLSACLHMFPQFVQYLLIFLVLLCVFGGAAYLVLCGTKSALLAFAVVMPFSHNITTFLSCSVDLFIFIIVILRYNWKHVLNIIIKKLSMVGTCMTHPQTPWKTQMWTPKWK